MSNLPVLGGKGTKLGREPSDVLVLCHAIILGRIVFPVETPIIIGILCPGFIVATIIVLLVDIVPLMVAGNLVGSVVGFGLVVVFLGSMQVLEGFVGAEMLEFIGGGLGEVVVDDLFLFHQDIIEFFYLLVGHLKLYLDAGLGHFVLLVLALLHLQGLVGQFDLF